jgi:hypothetical protein
MVTDAELECLGETEVKLRRDRGDWIDKTELRVVDSWLTQVAKEQKFREACERASRSAALDARRLAILSNVIAIGALVVSIIALIRSI